MYRFVAWAHLADECCTDARAPLDRASGGPGAEIERPAHGGRLDGADRRRVVVVKALEAIYLWSADRLPLTDVASAAHAALDQCRERRSAGTW